MLDFSGDQCPHCRAMEPAVRDLEGMGYPVRRINVNREPALAAQFGVERIPCFVMLLDGREVDRVVGATSFGRLQQMCSKALAAAVKTAAAVAAPAVKTTAAVAVPVSAPPVKGPVVSDATLIAQSVRLRVDDPDGRSCGSGTIIDARQGEALILTCGHIFRDSKGLGPIEVDLFGPGGVQRMPGKLIAYDLNNDVGLVSIRPAGQVAVARVAPPGYRVAPGETVVTVGCNNGDDPTAAHGRVLAVDKFRGPHNLQVEGEPVEGRSGGGVFSSDGMVVGICNAADRDDHAAYCAALPTIHAEMDRANVAFLYKEEPKGTWSPAAPPSAMCVVRSRATPAKEPPAEADQAAKLAPGEQAAWDEIQRCRKDGAKFVCIINSRDREGKSEMIMLDHVSPAFLALLAAQDQADKPPQPPSAEVRRPRKPLLEWDATAGYLHHELLPDPTPGR
jgi:thiol-disulfide isomerase/thioredoxin